ncbi:MAG: hypothetical protein ACOYO1_14240 [Bacteroidales bacterium]
MNNTKSILFFIFLFFSISKCFSQIVDGPANFRDKPNGKVLFQLQNEVQISLKDSFNGWYKCFFTGYVEIPQNITDYTHIPKGTKLYSRKLQLVGEVLYPIKYQYKGQIYKQKYALVEIVAFTFQKNIQLKSKESNSDKLTWSDSNTSDFKYFIGNEEYRNYSICKTTNYHEVYISLDNIFERCLIKEVKTQKRSDNSEKLESKIKLEFYPIYFKGDYNTKKQIEIEADNVYFSENFFTTVIKGCCDETDKYTVITYNSLKPLISCENKVFTYNTNNKTYILGFIESDYNKERQIGKWILTDLSGITDSLIIIAKDSNIYDMSLHFILPDKFYYNENESNSYYYNYLEEVFVADSNNPNEISFYMQSSDNNDSIKKSKIRIIKNRFSSAYKNKTFILGKD